MSASTSYSTLDDYVLNFRGELDTAAKSCLAGLELKIKDEGDDWLDAHLEAIFNTSTSGAIVEHLKTPSRTATAKKTRAKLEADKLRTDKIKSVNAKLALSPTRSMNGSPARLLFQPQPLGLRNQSPLQPRVLNTNISSNVASPSPTRAKAAPVKGKDKAPVVIAKKGKSKEAEDENSAPIRGSTTANSKTNQSPRQGNVLRSPVTRSTATSNTRAPLSPAATQTSPSRPAKSPLRQMTSPTRARAQPVSRPQSPRQAQQNTSHAPSRSAMSPHQTRPTAKDLSMIAEGASERHSTSARSPETIRSPARIRPMSPRLAQQAQQQQARSPPRREITQQPSIDAMLRPTAPTPAPAPAAAAPAPALPRQVRSSWLSKALGSGSVPSTSMDGNSALRKSVVPQSRPTLYSDYAGLRQSLAPPGGLKRKSDQGLDDDSEKAPRPEKAVKVEPAPTPAPAQVKPSLERQISLPPAPVSQPQTEILKVTKALEEIKERTHAKELAKQKAAAAARETAPGFLRGLTKSLGLGVGGKVETPEEEAERLARELEDDRQAEAEAQAELDRLMSGQGEKEEQIKSVEARSTTPVVSPLPLVSAPKASEVPEAEAHQGSDRTEEEEEEDMVEEISMAEIEVESDAEAEVETVQTTASAFPPRLGTPPKLASIRLSTTPTTTPPAHLAKVHQGGNVKAANIRSPLRNPAASQSQYQPQVVQQAAPKSAFALAPVAKTVPADEDEEDETADEEEDEEDEDYEMTEAEQENVTEHVKPISQINGKQPATTTARLPKSTSTTSLASLAPSHGLLNQASTIAAKTIGVKPTTAPVKSVQLAQAAAKKEQEANNQKQTFRELADARRREAARKKAEEEKNRAAEQERIRQQEIEKGNKLRAELERKKAERGPIMAQAMKSQDDRAKREAAAAKARAAEEEAARKRKMAPTLNKSTNAHPTKKPQTAPSTSNGNSNNGRETFRPTSSMKGSISTTNINGPAPAAKLGPTSFRTAPPPAAIAAASVSASTSTIKLVGANAPAAHLGPPSRPSGMTGTHPHPQWAHVPTGAAAGPSNILQQQRVALQTQLDEKALGTQSEDIVLPDINSEYSDSDDSEKSTDFKRPDWAESPELRAALERQATRNPDELFGPIKPISMEELFKVKVSKFRPRSSSANWASGDGVTKKEEVEYAKRMGFRGAGGRGEGSSGSAL